MYHETGCATARLFYNAGVNALFVVTDAEIACSVPGLRFTAMKAQIAILNKQHVHWYQAA